MQLTFIQTDDQAVCAKAIADTITGVLAKEDKALWLIPGGSNIPISVAAMGILRGMNSNDALARLAVTLTDERYGQDGHADSNWQQLIGAGFDFDGIKAVPVLKGLSLEKTVAEYGKTAADLFEWADVVVGQFGIGADGHIAGVLPHTVGVDSEEIAVAYAAETFTRATLTLAALSRMHVAFAFVFGESKREALSNLKEKDLSLAAEPSQVLKKVPEAYVYSDISLI
jgi:6-phosphogluconolactonase/glucosamine-6-phosphate isomerase/deaminase